MMILWTRDQKCVFYRPGRFGEDFWLCWGQSGHKSDLQGLMTEAERVSPSWRLTFGAASSPCKILTTRKLLSGPWNLGFWEEDGGESESIIKFCHLVAIYITCTFSHCPPFGGDLQQFSALYQEGLTFLVKNNTFLYTFIKWWKHHTPAHPYANLEHTMIFTPKD